MRALGQDPNFTMDLRESYNITVPIFSEAEEAQREADPNLNGNGKNKWPDPSLVSTQWRQVVRLLKNIIIYFYWKGDAKKPGIFGPFIGAPHVVATVRVVT